MQFQTAPEFASPDVGAAFRLVHPDAGSDRTGPPPSSEPGAFVKAMAGLWGAVRHLDGAFALIAKGAGKSGLASGSVLIEGREKLNIGLLMPALKRETQLLLSAPPPVDRFDDRFQRIVWALAERLDRVQIGRTWSLRLGERGARIYAGANGFAILDGLTDASAFLTALRDASRDELAVSYTLDEPPASLPDRLEGIAALFPGDGQPDVISLSDNGFPQAVPVGLPMSTLRVLSAARQRLNEDGLKELISFSVVDRSGRTLLSGRRAGEDVELAIASGGAAHG